MKEDLDRKEGAVPPGIEIPGIPARKLVNRWERGTWAVYTPMDDPADAALAVRLGERLRELKPYSDILDKMFTGLSDRLPNGERADTGWAPPTSTAVMDDGLRGAHAPCHRGMDMAGVP